jgi:peptidyl-prolyl cis-trans isomerase A (cyclophilin A)
MTLRSMVRTAMVFGALAGLMAEPAASQTPRGNQPARGTQAARGRANLNRAKLRTPSQLNAKAPDLYKAKFDTSQGVFVIEVHRDWAPIGADRFYNLVKNGFYDNCRFFRVLDGFMAQWGMTGDPALDAVWYNANIKDDPVKQSNKRGYVTFAKASIPNSRSTQIFINFRDNSRLDADDFAPFGQVVEGMEIVDKLHSVRGNEPDQGRIRSEGNAYLAKSYPQLDYIKTATVVP